MTTTAQSIIQQAQELLQDPEGIRWPATELVAHLNDGQREVAAQRPDLFTVTKPLALVPGARQTLPAACIHLVDILRNTNGASLSLTARAMLDALLPNWYNKSPTKNLVHFCYDLREPKVFFVYPPAANGASVDATYSEFPADLPTPTGPGAESVTGTLTGKDTLKNPLLHWVLFRAWSKDAEFGGNAALAQTHYALFMGGLKTDAAAAVQPTPTN